MTEQQIAKQAAVVRLRQAASFLLLADPFGSDLPTTMALAGKLEAEASPWEVTARAMREREEEQVSLPRSVCMDLQEWYSR